MMTVKEFIEFLGQFPQDAEVKVLCGETAEYHPCRGAYSDESVVELTAEAEH